MTNLTTPAAALKSAEEIATLEAVRAFLYKEARLLDDRQFDEWLECYHPDSEFWMPAWDVDDRLTEDPQNEISLIYYDNRGGIEDRAAPGSRLTGPRPPPFRSPAPGTTSPTSKSWSTTATK